MKPSLSDTDPKIEKVLIDLIKQKSIPERLKQTTSFSSLIINLSKRAIARRNVGKNKQELDLIFVNLHYGETLAEKVRLYLLNMPHE